MKIKCWISGNGSNNNTSNEAAGAKPVVIKGPDGGDDPMRANGQDDVGITEGGGVGVAGVARMRPTSLNVNQLNYHVVDLKKFVR